MEVKTYSPELQENRKPISILTTRVNSIVDSIDQLRLTMDHMIETQCKMKTKIDKISDKVFEKPEYLSVGEIALKEGVSDRTVRRRLKEKVIPFEKNKGEKAYRIPAEYYYQSLSSDGKSKWFQNHTRE
jgi:excisionase family DNA binding protein